jgi:arginine metabolism regulation protein II
LNPGVTPEKPSQHWERLTTIAYADAKHHMRMSLEHEFQGPKKAKYKEQLMANLSLATFAVSIGPALKLSKSNFLCCQI